MLRHDRELDELRQQGRVGAVRRHLHLVRPGDLGLDDLVELAELRAAEVRIGDPLDGVDQVFRPQRRAVVEFHVVAQGELDFGVRQALPRRRDLRDDLTLVVAGDDVVEDVAVDVVAVRIPLKMGIQRGGFVDEVDGDLFLGLGRAAQRTEGQHNPHGGDTRQCAYAYH